MLLAIDSGNTNIVFAIYEGETRRGEWRSATNANRTADEYAVWLSQLMALENLSRRDVNAAIIANVVPKADYPLRTLCRQYFGCEPMLVGGPDVDLGIEVLMDKPHEVGADRLANAVGAHARYPGPLVVIDFGTATTFDVIDARGNYCGGIIAPGINLSLEALDAAAAKLPRVAIKRPRRVVGKDTVSAMQSGIFWGYVALIEGLVARVRSEVGAELTVIATGGLAPLFNEATSAIQHLDPHLTMRGLLAIHRRNTKG